MPARVLSTEPASHIDARQRLAEAGADVRDIVRVDCDAILFTDSLGRPQTGWLKHSGARLVIVVEHGFGAEPSAATLRRFPGSESYVHPDGPTTLR